MELALLDRVSEPMLSAKALVFDVDGTLTAGDAVGERATRALAGAASTGVEVVVISGRNRRSTTAVLTRAGITGWTGSLGGAVVADPCGRVVHHQHLDPDHYRAMVDLGRDRGAAVIWCGTDEILAERANPAVDFMFAVHDAEPQYGSAPDFEVGKVMLAGDPALLDTLTDDLAQLAPRAGRSMDVFFELSPEGSEKAQALQRICAGLGISTDQVIGFGDGGNDLDWLPLTGWAIVPASARAPVQAIADLVVPPAAEDGVAQFVEAWTRLRNQ